VMYPSFHLLKMFFQQGGKKRKMNKTDFTVTDA
jgi:hypothetical protein